MITKQQILDCNDNQQLCDWAAEYCMGLHLIDYSYPFSDGYDYATEKSWTNNNGRVWFVREPDENPDVWGGGLSIWQPLSPTDKGKAQCWDLMVKYRIIVVPYGRDEWTAAQDTGKTVSTEIVESDAQTAVLKAALCTEIDKRG